MKIAVMSCIHGNYEALDAVLLDIDKHSCEKIYCLGDLVGYGPYPSIAKLLSKPSTLLHVKSLEWEMWGALQGKQLIPYTTQAQQAWNSTQFATGQIRVLESVKPKLSKACAGRLCNCSPRLLACGAVIITKKTCAQNDYHYH